MSESEQEEYYTDKYNEEIQHIVECSYICQRIPENLQSVEFKNIVNIINNFLLNHCEHDIVNDSIDIDPDKSESISYCIKCNITFSK